MNFDEFNVTVFEQISNSYRKLSETTSTETPVDADDLAATTEEYLKQDGEEEEGEGDDHEEDYDRHEPPPPVATVR